MLLSSYLLKSGINLSKYNTIDDGQKEKGNIGQHNDVIDTNNLQQHIDNVVNDVNETNIKPIIQYIENYGAKKW